MPLCEWYYVNLIYEVESYTTRAAIYRNKQVDIVEIQYACLTFQSSLTVVRKTLLTFYFGVPVTVLKTSTE